MKKCQRYRKLIWLSIYNELSAEEMTELKLHLKTCKECQFHQMNVESTLKVLNQMPEMEIKDNVLDESRQELHRRLMYEKKKSSNSTWIEGILKRFTFHNPPVYQFAASMALVLIGFFIGKYVYPDGTGIDLPGHGNDMQNITKINHIEYEPGTRQVKIEYDVSESRSVEGNINREPIQRLLTKTMVASPQTNIRLNSVRALSRTTEFNSKLTKSLMDVVIHDENPGVRLKAIKLINSVPLSAFEQDDLISFYMRTILAESNSSISNQAIDGLSRFSTDESMNLLANLAEDDSSDYLQYKVKKERNKLKLQKISNN